MTWPIVFLVYVYYKIYKVLGEITIHTIGEESQPRRFATGLQYQKSNIRILNNRQQRMKNQQVKATRLMVLMSATILLSWIPLYIYFAVVMLRVFLGIQSPVEGPVEKLLGMTAILSSLCSPCLYGVANETLRTCMMFAFLPLSWKKKYEDSRKQQLRRRKTEAKPFNSFGFKKNRIAAVTTSSTAESIKANTRSIRTSSTPQPLSP